MANPQKEDGYNYGIRNNWKFQRDLRSAKVLVWKRDKGVCVLCREKKDRYDVDHKTPISKGGDAFSLDNLQTICRTCHILKTSRERSSNG